MNLSFIAPALKEDKLVVQLQKEAVEEASKKWLNGLILYVLGSTPTLDFMNAFVEKEWNMVVKPKVLFHDVDGYFIAKFNSLDDRNTVICSGPWYVGTEPIVMKPWNTDFRFQKEEFLGMIPLWVQFPNLPLNCWEVDSLSRISSVIGKPLYADESTLKQSKITHARVLIDTDVKKPLPETVTVEDPSGKFFDQKVVFEWKPLNCSRVPIDTDVKKPLPETVIVEDPSGKKIDQKKVFELKPLNCSEVPIDSTVKKPLPENVIAKDPNGKLIVQKVVFEYKPFNCSTLATDVSHSVNQQRRDDFKRKPVTVLGSADKNAGGAPAQLNASKRVKLGSAHSPVSKLVDAKVSSKHLKKPIASKHEMAIRPRQGSQRREKDPGRLREKDPTRLREKVLGRLRARHEKQVVNCRKAT